MSTLRIHRLLDKNHVDRARATANGEKAPTRPTLTSTEIATIDPYVKQVFLLRNIDTTLCQKQLHETELNQIILRQAIDKIKDPMTKSSVQSRLSNVSKDCEEQKKIISSVPTEIADITADRIERLTRVIPIDPVREKTKALNSKVSLYESKTHATSQESVRAVTEAKPLIVNDSDRVALDKFAAETRKTTFHGG